MKRGSSGLEDGGACDAVEPVRACSRSSRAASLCWRASLMSWFDGIAGAVL
jgi:hypothetical protein